MGRRLVRLAEELATLGMPGERVRAAELPGEDGRKFPGERASFFPVDALGTEGERAPGFRSECREKLSRREN